MFDICVYLQNLRKTKKRTFKSELIIVNIRNYSMLIVEKVSSGNVKQ
jgi:hypothetical protein